MLSLNPDLSIPLHRMLMIVRHLIWKRSTQHRKTMLQEQLNILVLTNWIRVFFTIAI